MIIHGYMASRFTGDIFAIQMDSRGAIIGAFGPIKEEEAIRWEIDRPFAYSTSIGELIQGNREEFQILYLNSQPDAKPLPG